jgi:hypothetical protein
MAMSFEEWLTQVGKMKEGANHLALISYGFLLYGVKDSECGVIAAPVVPLVPHRATLAFLADSVDESKSTVNVNKVGEFSTVDLSDTKIQISQPRGAARTRDFGRLVDFTTLCCDVALKAGWRKSKDLCLVVELAGGVIHAVPDAHMKKKAWTWDGCDGSRHRERRLTDKTAYLTEASESGAIALTFTSIQRGEALGQLVFKPGLAVAALLHQAVDKTPRNDDVLELSHFAAMLSICHRSGPVQFTIAQAVEKHKEVDEVAFPRWIATFLKGEGISFRIHGKPNCGGRKMNDPGM